MGLEVTSCEEQLNLLMLSLEARSPWEDLMAMLGNRGENKVGKREKIALGDKNQDNGKLKGR